MLRLSAPGEYANDRPGSCKKKSWTRELSRLALLPRRTPNWRRTERQIVKIETEVGERRDSLHLHAGDRAIGIERKRHVGVGEKRPVGPASDERIELPMLQSAGECWGMGEAHDQVVAFHF